MIHEQVPKYSSKNRPLQKKQSHFATSPKTGLTTTEAESPEKQPMPNYTPLPADWEASQHPLLKNRANVTNIVQTKTADGEKQSLSRESVSSEEQSNHTGMPNQLKAGLEHLSGRDLSDVRVHRNSSKPSQVQALAYTQGTNIYLGPGQERHLPHEGWHVVQQMAGRVKPTMQMAGGVSINDDAKLEREADIMGSKALGVRKKNLQFFQQSKNPKNEQLIQRKVGYEFEVGWQVRRPPENEIEREEVKTADVNLQEKMKKGWTQLFQRLYQEKKGRTFENPDVPSSIKVKSSIYKAHQHQLVNQDLITKHRRWGRTTKYTIPKEAFRQKDVLYNYWQQEGFSKEAKEEYGALIDYVEGMLNIPKATKIMAAPHKIAERPLWHLTADMNSGISQLEWVTEPLETKEQVTKAMNEITAMGTRLEDLAKDKTIITASQLSTVGSITDAFKVSGFNIYPEESKQLEAAPQVTGGFRLDQVANMMQKVMTETIYLEGCKGQEKHNITKALEESAKIKHKKINLHDYSAEIEGLIAMILNYLWQASNEREPLSNSKSIASAFMSRTDFAHNSQLVPELSSKELSQEEFLGLIREVTELDLNQKVFPVGFKHQDSEINVYQYNLTRAEWIKNMAQGRDLLKKRNEDLQAKELHSSLGALGTVDDTVGDEKKRAIVIELRRMAQKQPLKEWKTIAEKAFLMIEKFNNP